MTTQVSTSSTSTPTSASGANPAPASVASQAAPSQKASTPVEAARMMKLKIDGQEMEMSESEVIKLAQQSKAADKRFQEAAKARQSAEQLVTFLKANPKEALKNLGIDVRKFSEDALLEMIQHEQMTPEQRKAMENEQKLRKYEDDEKAEKEKTKQEQMAKLEREQMESYDKMFVDALTLSGLPKTPYTVKRMAELTLVNLKKKLELEPSQLAKIVREDYEAEMKALYGQADGDTLLSLLGKDAVKKLSKAQLSKYKAAKTNNSQPQPRPAEKKDDRNPSVAWRQMQKKTRSMI